MLTWIAFIFGAFSGMAVLVVCAACIVSSRASRAEEGSLSRIPSRAAMKRLELQVDPVKDDLDEEIYAEIEVELAAQLEEIRRRGMGRLGRLADVQSG